MKLNRPLASWYIPDNKLLDEAIKRTTHMSIAAHHDDIEIMAYDGILQCLGKNDAWFLGVVVTNGSGSARDGAYKDFTDDQMIEVRRHEQRKAAKIGEFGALALLEYTSNETKDPKNKEIMDDLEKILLRAKPNILYTHNLADKHETHIAVTTKVIQTIRRLPKEARPQKVYGCEVWRDLDWMLDQEKVQFNVSGHPSVAQALLEVFDSQIIGGKRYDVATMGRRAANATFTTSHKVDRADQIINAMDLTPLIENDQLDLVTYVTDYIDRFKNDVILRINKMIEK